MMPAQMVYEKDFGIPEWLLGISPFVGQIFDEVHILVGDVDRYIQVDDRQIDRYIGRQVDTQIDTCIGGWIDGQIERQMIDIDRY